MSNFHAAEGMFPGAFHTEGHSGNEISSEPFLALGGSSSFPQAGCGEVVCAGVKQPRCNSCPTAPSESFSLKAGS